MGVVLALGLTGCTGAAAVPVVQVHPESPDSRVPEQRRQVRPFVKVPDVTELHLRKARAVLRNADIRLIEIEEVWLGGRPYFYKWVFRQAPKPGTRILAGRKVTLEVCCGPEVFHYPGPPDRGPSVATVRGVGSGWAPPTM